MTSNETADLNRVRYGANIFKRVDLVEPTSSGYLLLVGEVDRRPPWFPASRAKRELLTEAKQLCKALASGPDVISAYVFRAAIIPPGGEVEFLASQKGRVHVARFDVAVLIETESVTAALDLQRSAAFRGLERRFRNVSRYAETIAARNVRNMGPLNQTRGGVFLFNYFYAASPSQNLAVWEYTAGWFHQETKLNNSAVLQPLDPEATGYTLINHCRWDRWRDVLPALIFKPSFRRYVLANFEANKTAPMPVLYRLA